VGRREKGDWEGFRTCAGPGESYEATCAGKGNGTETIGEVLEWESSSVLKEKRPGKGKGLAGLNNASVSHATGHGRTGAAFFWLYGEG